MCAGDLEFNHHTSLRTKAIVCISDKRFTRAGFCGFEYVVEIPLEFGLRNVIQLNIHIYCKGITKIADRAGVPKILFFIYLYFFQKK